MIGAATAVGHELSLRLLELGHPPTHLALSALQPRTVSWNGRSLSVGTFGEHRGCDWVFLCSAHPQAVEAARRALAGGSRLLDLSGSIGEAELAAPCTGLERPGVFAQSLRLPSRSATLIGPLLATAHRAFGLAEAHVVVLASAADEGARGLMELHGELTQREPGRDPHPDRGAHAPAGREARAPAGPLPSQGATPAAQQSTGTQAPQPAQGTPGPRASSARVGNVLVTPTGAVDRELVLTRELLQLSGAPSAVVEASLLRVDAERCDSFSLHLQFAQPVSVRDFATLLVTGQGIQGGVRVVEDGASGGLGPRFVREEDPLLVGRIRAGSRGPGSLCCFAVGDQLRTGGAEAALRLAAGLETS